MDMILLVNLLSIQSGSPASPVISLYSKGIHMVRSVFKTGIVLALGLILTQGCFDSGGGGGGGNNQLRSADGLGGFVWKPRSESNGRLVVLFPAEFRGRHSGMAIHRGNPPRASNKIEDGVFSNETHNGGRVHYRFSKTGAAYGGNLYATLYLKDGGTVSYFIPNGGGRVD